MRLLSTTTEPKVLTPADVEALVVKLARACAELPIELLYLHGAYARGTQGPLSDLDLAVQITPAAARDRQQQLELLFVLQDLCGREDVDLVILNTAGPIIKDRVVRGGRLVYARSERARVQFEAAAIKEALDFRYFGRVYDAALFRQLAGGPAT